MICSACSHENRPGAKFCEECAAALARRCPSCGAEVRPAAKFCDACGSGLRPPAGQNAEVRKVVTVVFADLIGSTSLHARLDAESARRVMDRYYGALRRAVEAHRGTVVKLLGDGVVAAFGVPVVADDDVLSLPGLCLKRLSAFSDQLGSSRAERVRPMVWLTAER